MENAYLGPLERRLRRTLSPAAAEDVYDAVRQHALDKLSAYEGRSSLRTWLNGVARRKVRESWRRARRQERVAAMTHELGHVMGEQAGDPELAYLRRHFSHQFKAAMRSALVALNERDRALFRKHLVEAKNVDALARDLGVHRATAARRVARIREDLVQRIHETLAAELGLAPGEAKSLRALLVDQLDLSVTRLL
jgi:RNA polymerase sigma-70 factor (ECF subfamily)